MARKKTDFELNYLKRVRKSVTPDKFSFLPKLIVETIQRGISPVQGGGRFAKYSESYRDAISKAKGEIAKKQGKLSPVDMTLSGDMNRSLDIIKGSKEGAVKCKFDDPKAYYHNTSGVGKARTIRRLLPDREGESFSRNIQQKILDAFKDLARRAAKK